MTAKGGFDELAKVAGKEREAARGDVDGIEAEILFGTRVDPVANLGEALVHGCLIVRTSIDGGGFDAHGRRFGIRARHGGMNELVRKGRVKGKGKGTGGVWASLFGCGEFGRG